MRVNLYINYWHGKFFMGNFSDRATAEKHYNANKERYRDYAGEKYGYPYGTPVYVEEKENKQ